MMPSTRITWTKKYTGVGSRQTPQKIIHQMTRIATRLSEIGYTLRSGGADGADVAFELGATHKEIYLPWAGFNGNQSPLNTVSDAALALAEKRHPAWDKLSPAARQLHARNCYQLLGPNLDDPTDFLVCWTPDGATNARERGRETGGTGQAISLADQYGVPVFNLALPEALGALGNLLSRRAADLSPLGAWDNYLTTVTGINIFSGEQGLGAALTNPTQLAVEKGNLSHGYPLRIGARKFTDVEDAYHALKTEDDAKNDELMVSLIATKFKQYPTLYLDVDSAGGSSFLKSCTHFTNARKERSQSWEGSGLKSRFIRNLVAGFEQAEQDRGRQGSLFDDDAISL